MKKNELKIKKVILFFQKLPSPLINDIFEKFNANRSFRRQLSKIVSYEEKINFIMFSSMRENFFTAAYFAIKDRINLSLEKAKYDDIIYSMTDDNKLYYTIFFFKWCCEKGTDGVENNMEYFENFVDSKLFDQIINGQSIVDINKKSTYNKVKIRDFAKDLNVSPKEVIEVVSNYLGVEKNVGASFINEELDIVLEKLTQDHQVDSFDEYFADGEKVRHKEKVKVKKTEESCKHEIGESNEQAIQKNNLDNFKEIQKGHTEMNEIILLGRIEKRYTYFNFFPQYELTSGGLNEISSVELESEYPTIGAINLACTLSGKPYSYLENEIQTDIDTDSQTKNVYFVKFEKSDLKENNDERYKIKIDLESMVRNGHKLENIIKSASSAKVYKVVTSESTIISLTNLANKPIFLKENNLVESEFVALYHEDKYYGPFNVGYRAQDGRFYILTGANDKNYIIPYYSSESVKEIEFEKQAYFEAPSYTTYIQVIGEQSFFDAITDETLLEKITEDISFDLAKTNPSEFAKLCHNSPFFLDFPDEIAESRIDKLDKIINNTEKFNEEKHRIFESLLNLYQSQTSDVADEMVKQSALYKDLQSKYDAERRKNANNETNILNLRKNNTELSAKLIEANQKKINDATPEEILRLKKENEDLHNKLTKLDEFSKIQVDIDNLKKEQQKLENNNDYLREQAKNYEEKIKTAQDDISKAIKNGVTNSAAVAFDPYISSKMIKEAALWDAKDEDKEYDECQERIAALKPSSLCDDQLVNYIVEHVQALRDYSRNDIINIYVNIAQNFITIFSGEPGTGKTSMCSIISDTLGLMKFGDSINRFVPVSVEKGWSTKRDLIGYFNPLTRKYDKSNSKIYDALRILDSEKNKSIYPFIIMLDEANLSPMEYYWADFMSLTDRESLKESYINIGTDKEIFIPETLRFIATINTDQTTESLSPRLIDRACIITLPKPKSLHEPKKEEDMPIELITWDNFIKAFSKKSELAPSTLKAFKEIYDLFNAYGMNVSPRIRIGIERYVKAAQCIMVDESDVLSSEKAIDYAVIQKLLPKINGYYANYERFFDLLKQLCKDYHLKMTNNAIDKMINDQERNMGYCQYLV